MLDLKRPKVDVSAGAPDQNGSRRFDQVKIEDRRVNRAFRRLEGVAEAFGQRLGRSLVCPDRHAAAHVQEYCPELVDAMRMVRMRMGEYDPVKVADARGQKLLAQIRRGVDKYAGDLFPLAALDQQRTPLPAVLRIGGIATTPYIANTGNAARGAASEDREPETHAAGASRKDAGALALPKSRKKFSLVILASCSAGISLISASLLSVCRTNAGSLTFPRCGTGARYGASVSTRMRSSGADLATARISSAFLKVRMPENEM